MQFFAAKSSFRLFSKPASHVYIFTLSEFADEVNKQHRRQLSEIEIPAGSDDSEASGLHAKKRLAQSA